jgi:rare lipoprotein A
MFHNIFFLIAINLLFACESPESSFRTKRMVDRNYGHLDYKNKENYNKIQEITQDIEKYNIEYVQNNQITQENLTPIPKGKYQGYYKIGNPYEIDGIKYIPQKYNYLEEVGEASWYGPKFHGKLTANGEIYNMYDITAAHRTMPMPSIAKVTNLENGKSIKVRINDRGPFANDRIIDLSKKSAQILGFEDKGVINVRVKYLSDETEELLQTIGLK